MNSILPNEEEFQLSDHYSKKGKKSALFIFFLRRKALSYICVVMKLITIIFCKFKTVFMPRKKKACNFLGRLHPALTQLMSTQKAEGASHLLACF